MRLPTAEPRLFIDRNEVKVGGAEKKRAFAKPTSTNGS
jgi:hypothetical protein